MRKKIIGAVTIVVGLSFVFTAPMHYVFGAMMATVFWWLFFGAVDWADENESKESDR